MQVGFTKDQVFSIYSVCMTNRMIRKCRGRFPPAVIKSASKYAGVCLWRGIFVTFPQTAEFLHAIPEYVIDSQFTTLYNSLFHAFRVREAHSRDDFVRIRMDLVNMTLIWSRSH